MRANYSAMVEVLATLNSITDDGMGAFRARIRKLQGEGVPLGSNPGKGKSVAYTFAMVFELAIAVELIQCGLSPSEAAGMIVPVRDELYLAALMAARNADDDQSNPVVLISPELLKQYSNTSSYKGHDDVMGAVSIVTRHALSAMINSGFSFGNDPITGAYWRWSMIDINSIVNHLLAYLETELIDFEVDDFISEETSINQAGIAEFQKSRLNVVGTWGGTEGGASTVKLVTEADDGNP